MRLPRSAAVGLMAAVLCGSLAGCASFQELTSSSTPLLGKSSTNDPSTEPSPSVSVSVSSSAAAEKPVRASGPLDTGSVVHRVKQGAFTVTLTYWTSDNAKLYTAGSNKTLNIAAHIEDTDGKQRVTVSTFQVTQDDGAARANVRTDNGKFDVTPPYPYNTVVTLPAATAGATALTLTVRMDLLVETAPEADTYYRSTALDSLTLPLVKDGATDD